MVTTSFGKKLKNAFYIHVVGLDQINLPYIEKIKQLIIQEGLENRSEFNVIKITYSGDAISFLHYQNFFDDPFPKLIKSLTCNLVTGLSKVRSYEHSLNPPILHRKELLLPPEHSKIQLFKSLTTDLEKYGLFKNTRSIGFFQNWSKKLDLAGIEIIDHKVIAPPPIDINDIATQVNSDPIYRHKTAITRYSLSAPVQALSRHNYLEGQHDFFDYGCGKGSDIQILKKNNISATGWDPHFSPDEDVNPADIVNLGFVLNVIEDADERIEALLNAFSLCKKLLVVAVMLTSNAPRDAEKFHDGILTQRNTFQKYYTQDEFRNYLSEVLDEDPIAVAPGIFFVYKDKISEQIFLEAKYKNRTGLSKIISCIPKPTVEEREKQFYHDHKDLFDNLWLTCLMQGRMPRQDEYDQSKQVSDVFGSMKKGLNFILRYHGDEALVAAENARREDLTVYFGMQQFEGREQSKFLSEHLRRDVKFFFGSLKTAQNLGKELLFSAGDTDKISLAVNLCASESIGFLDDDEAFHLHGSQVSSLPNILRIYIGCAAQLYGDIEEADLIKVHTLTGKLTLTKFDDFENSPIPRMTERVKIRLRDQSVQLYNYGNEYAPPYLYFKSRFIPSDFNHYSAQKLFDESLLNINLFNFSGYGPAPAEFDLTLKKSRLKIEGFELLPSDELPDLNDLCGQYYTFKDFIACGETQAKSNLSNTPKQAKTYNALHFLAKEVIDPVIDYFGGIQLTYGFCSRELAKEIPNKIAPSRDQHASHELNTRNNLICKRKGAAVDFIVKDEDMLEVAQWIVKNTGFDRLYFYGMNQPIHVSVGPDKKGEIVIMSPGPSGKLIPRVVKKEAFIATPFSVPK
jgi:DNA phosphorothioation-associated putative methyltransferase